MSRAGGNRASEEVGSTIDVVGGGGGGGATGEFNCLDAIASGDAGVFGAAADFAPPISTQERVLRVSPFHPKHQIPARR